MIAKIEKDFQRLWEILSTHEKTANKNLIRKFKKVERKLLAIQYQIRSAQTKGVNA